MRHDSAVWTPFCLRFAKAGETCWSKNIKYEYCYRFGSSNFGLIRLDSKTKWMSRAAGAARFRFVASLLACCAGKRFAFPQLRTLAGSNPSALGTKTKGPHFWEPINSVVGDEGSRVRLAPPAFASSLRSSRAALENASRFLSSAPLRVRIPLHWARKRKAPISGSLSNQWWAMRDSNPQPCACKAPALTVAPIARRD